MIIYEKSEIIRPNIHETVIMINVYQYLTKYLFFIAMF